MQVLGITTLNSCLYDSHLEFGAAPAGDMFQRNLDEIFKELPNEYGWCGIADAILVVGYDNYSNDHDRSLSRVLQICLKESHKTMINAISGKPVFLFGEIIYRYGMKPDITSWVHRQKCHHPNQGKNYNHHLAE